MKGFLLDKPGVVTSRSYVEGDQLVIEDRMEGRDVQRILDSNARIRNDGQPTRALGRHMARIPLPVYDSWRKEWDRGYKDKWSWDKYLTMKINSSDHSLLRTGGKL